MSSHKQCSFRCFPYSACCAKPSFAEAASPPFACQQAATTGNKRERSSTGLAMQRQQQLLSAMMASGSGANAVASHDGLDMFGLKSVWGSYSHSDSFGRHFPTARVTSKDRNISAVSGLLLESRTTQPP